MGADPFVRIRFDGRADDEEPRLARKKLRFRHQDLRDAVTATGKTLADLFNDPFGGWPHLLVYGLRWSDTSISLNKASEYIDQWVDSHMDEKEPLSSLGQKLLAALNASGMVKVAALDEEKRAEAESEGNERASQ